jgi:malonyl CoA-acyl carrier protein transacylase
MALAVEAPDGSGSIRLLPGITEDTPSYTFTHPAGLLFATQFTQPALVLVEKAAFDDLRDSGVVPARVLFAGHSLGACERLFGALCMIGIRRRAGAASM